MPDYDEGQVYDRDYVDNFSIKEFAVNDLMPKYFPDDVSHLTVGLEGMITDYVGTVTEDAFNAASTYLMETFPSRAQFSSSIYANAAIFQLSNAFSTPAQCEFLILLDTKDIKKNFIQKQGDRYKYFYIDKDTTFYVEDIPFTLDYDIAIKAKYLRTKNNVAEYIYSARYLTTGYKNSTSELNDPYIKARLSKNGYLALQVTMHQVERSYHYEELTDNTGISYPTIQVTYTDLLAGIDVLYKAPGDDDFNTQLTLKPKFSQPTREPFCYYKKIDDEKILLSFTTKDGYFQPKYNSEIKVITYTTLGEDGQFDSYSGDDVTITKNDDNYQYDYAWTITAKPVGSSYGAKNQISLDALKDLTIEGFSTANALTTNHDLDLYFNNFKNKYLSEVLFMKKRDDAVERLFSAFLYVKLDDYIYPTNTLTIDTNLYDFDYKEGGYYNMDPGYLFGYKTDDAYFTPIKYWDALDDRAYYMKGSNGVYYYYMNDEKTDPIVSLSEEEIQKRILAKDLIPGNQEWYKVNAQNYTLYDENGVVTGDYASTITEEELLVMFKNREVAYGRVENSGKLIEFLTDTDLEAAQRKNYIDYKPSWEKKNNKKVTYSEYVFEYSYDDYKEENNIDNRISVFDDDFESKIVGRSFVFTNPFLTSITKTSGLVAYYLTHISTDHLLDFMKQNDDDTFVQFITYTLHVNREIGTEKKYRLSLTLLPSVSIESESPLIQDNTVYDPTAVKDTDTQIDQFVHPTNGDELVPSLQTYNKELLKKNDLRVVLTFFEKNNEAEAGYMELVPTKVDKLTDQITFEGVFETDDYITNDNRFRAVHRCPYCGNVILNSANKNIENFDYFCDKCGSTFKEGIINIRETDDILLPITEADIKITILYRDSAEEITPTNNNFAQYNDTYKDYQWTNEYETILNPVTFIQPLNMVRGTIDYQDYYITGINAMDCYLYDVPMLKYSILAYRDEGMEVTDPMLSDDIGKFYQFIKQYKEHYDFLNIAKLKLRNATNIDMKFYNTYGRSTNFKIGDNKIAIDTNNISIAFDVWVVPNTDILDARSELKDYIKNYIESINTDGTNDLYISNLIRSIENDFPYVHHLEFKGINDYDTSFQSIKNEAISLTNLSKEERRHFVPELLVINKNNIILDVQEAE